MGRCHADDCAGAIRVGLFALLARASRLRPMPPGGGGAARTIKIVISVPPGGTIDFLVRVIADYLGRTRGQTIVVESRPGAGSIIAAETVARAAPDGATLLINSNGQMISPILRKVNFDPRTSFEPICFLVGFAAGAGGQQQVAVPHARRSRRGGARETRRALDLDGRAQHHPAHRGRALQARRRHQSHLCAVHRRRARHQCAARRARHRGAAEFLGGRRAW